MTHGRVDYDAIARVYDRPERSKSVDADVPARGDVLDVGCGTGLWVAVNAAARPGARFTGVDRHRGMLDVARSRGTNASWVHGDAAALPLRDASFDFVTNQFSYHHVGDPHAVFSELARVARPGAPLVVQTVDPWSMRGWLVYRYFPQAFEIDAARFLPVEGLAALLERCGFEPPSAMCDRRRSDEAWSETVAYCSQRHATSQLIVIDDGAYRDGLAALERDARAGGTTPTEVCYVELRSRRTA